MTDVALSHCEAATKSAHPTSATLIDGVALLEYARQQEDSAPQGERADDFDWEIRVLGPDSLLELLGGRRHIAQWLESGGLDSSRSDLTRPIVVAPDEFGSQVIWDGVHRAASAAALNRSMRAVCGTARGQAARERGG
jgi:hypothetical protein